MPIEGLLSARCAVNMIVSELLQYFIQVDGVTMQAGIVLAPNVRPCVTPLLDVRKVAAFCGQDFLSAFGKQVSPS
jgi:hypothetical protein